MAKIVFLKRAVITLDDGQIIYGQEGQFAELDGEHLEKALDAGDVDLAPENSEDADAAPADAAPADAAPADAAPADAAPAKSKK